MPRKEINYSKTIIYKLVCNDPSITDVYVGHTTDFIRRKQGHKTVCNNENSNKYNLYVYQFIRNNGGFNNWEMIEIEKYPCNDTHEATVRERHWLETLGATLNRQVPTRTTKEWRETNREQLIEKAKEYYESNKEIINEKNKEYRKENREQINEKNKEYYEANRDRLNEYQKEYQKENREQLNEKKKEIITCECGCELTKGNLATHRKTKKHLKYLDNLI
jgi:hypothetical protein